MRTFPEINDTQEMITHLVEEHQSDKFSDVFALHEALHHHGFTDREVEWGMDHRHGEHVDCERCGGKNDNNDLLVCSTCEEHLMGA